MTDTSKEALRLLNERMCAEVNNAGIIFTEDVADMLDKIKALAAENDRLKARVAELEGVLHRIDDASNHYALTTTYSEGTLRYAHESTRNLARTALKNKDASDD